MGEDGYDLRWKNHLSEMFSVLRRLRLRDSFSDVILFCGGEHFRAHKVLLAAGSSFFERLLAPLPPDRSQVLVIAGVSARMLRLMLDFVYVGEVFVDASSLDEFMQTADKLEMRGLRREGGNSLPDASAAKNEGAMNLNKTPERNSEAAAENSAASGGGNASVSSAGCANDEPGPSKRRRNSEEGGFDGPNARLPPRDASAAMARLERINASGFRLQAIPRRNDAFRGNSMGNKDEDGAGRARTSDGRSPADFVEVDNDTKPEMIESGGDFNFSNDGEWQQDGDFSEEDHSNGGRVDLPFQMSPGQGGANDRPLHIPPEISAAAQLMRWKPGTLVWQATQPSGYRTYFCEVCGYLSALSGNVRVHTYRHTGQKPYSCQTCGRSFRHKNTLRLHVVRCLPGMNPPISPMTSMPHCFN